jgi:hypothetical protein
VTELDLIDALSESMKKQGYIVATEVPFMSQSIDLVVEINGALIAIEAKLHNWKRAINQAATHLLGADAVYVCMPLKKPPVKMIERLRQLGIGLILHQHGSIFEIRLKANQLESVLEFPRIWLREGFEMRWKIDGD